MFLYIFKIIIKLIITSSRFDPSSTSKPLNLSLLRFNEQSGSENLGFTHRLKLQSKRPFSQSKISQFQSLGVEYGYRGTFPLFLMTSLNFLLWVTVGQSFRPVEPHFPHRAETWEQKPTELGNILTIPNLRGGNMGIGEPSLSSSQPRSISSSGWLWVEVLDLLCFYIFSTLLLLAFWFSLVKAPLAFVYYTLWILDLILHQ